MKTILLFVLAIALLISSCSNDKKTENQLVSSGQLLLTDTLSINQTLRSIEENNDYSNDSTILLLEQAENECSELSYEQGLAYALFLKGNYLYARNHYKDAQHAYNKCLNLSIKLNNFLLQAKCLERKASVHLATDDTGLALSLYYKSLALFEKVGHKVGIAKVYNALGIYYAAQNEFSVAKMYYNKAILLNTLGNNSIGLIHNKGNLAYMYQQQGLTTKAKALYTALIKELTKSGDHTSLSVMFYNLASLYQGQHAYDSCLTYLRKASFIANSNQDSSLLSTLYGNTGEVHFLTHNFDSAKFYLSKSLKCSRTIHDIETELQALNFLVKIDSAQGNLGGILEKTTQISVLKDTLTRKQIKHNFLTSKLEYENQQKENLVALQQLKIEMHEKQQKFYVVVSILSILLATFLASALFYRKRNYVKDIKLKETQLRIQNLEFEKVQQKEEQARQRLNEAEQDIKIKGQELITTALQYEQNLETLNAIKRSINELPETNSTQVISEIESALKSLTNELYKQDIFNQKFTALHATFFGKLKEAHPELTKNELKFCAYLRIHLSSNQIAIILNITQEAIRKTRYRIRKKMNLDSKASLENYLDNF